MPSIPEAREDDPKLDLAAEILRRCGTVQLKAWGTSMLPSVWPGDLLTTIRIPATWAGAQFYFEKVRERQGGDFSIVNVAAVVLVAGSAFASSKGCALRP